MKIGEAIARLRQVPDAIQSGIEASAPLLADRISAGFDSGTDPYGRPWAPLSPRTLAKGRTPPPLTDTGAMRDAITVTGDGYSVAIYSPDEKSSWHQEGDGAPGQDLPARPFLPESELPDTWVADMQQSIDAEIGKLGLS